MKDAATGFSFLAMCGLVSIGLVFGCYAVDVAEYALDVQAKADAQDEWVAVRPDFNKVHGMLLPVEVKK